MRIELISAVHELLNEYAFDVTCDAHDTDETAEKIVSTVLEMLGITDEN